MKLKKLPLNISLFPLEMLDQTCNDDNGDWRMKRKCEKISNTLIR